MATACLKYCFTILVITISALAPQSMSRIIPEASIMERHNQWMARYGRVYKDVIEKKKRYRIFKANVEYIESVNNAEDKPYKLSVNQFADQTNDEFKKAHIAYRNLFKTKSSAATSFKYENVTAVPPSIDWRKKGAVTSIRDAICGGWTFPAVDTVEGITKIKGGKLYTLSVQEIVDCNNEGKNGCGGGFTSEAFEFIKQHGLTTESNYPTKGKVGTCDTKKEADPVAKISGYENVPVDSEEALMKAVANQPVAVSIDAAGADFQFYSSGVFTGQCGTTLDHGVTVVGYGTEKGKLKYWIIKNSWGTTWGEDGYMRLQKDINAKEGLCGISMEATYPTV
ncbi:Senescence-specific cysteine protease SAG12 [Forsythia ovata]|uniref:Senescence-specific cysteine protease SAG12 n=1 Tax=Forsythia ovata TaxID=205694 RepID=A0ABD1S2N0_9LAMI